MGGKKKKKKQETTSLSSSFRSSSYRQENVSPTAHQKTANVGCMSGIFHIMSKYHTRRKFLTFGRKQERNAIVQPPPLPPPEKNQPPKVEETVTCDPRDQGTSAGRLSLDEAPRSPAIPPEVRRSSTDNIMSPRVVQRLMGLHDFPVTLPPSTAAEKRRNLLGALEKCDEDLKSLKKIIETVRASQTPPWEVLEEAESEGPSPVSVLDYHHLSPSYSNKISKDQTFQQQKPIRQQKQQLTRKRPGDDEDKAMNFHSKASVSVIVGTTPQQLHRRSRPLLDTATTPWSTAMKESVIEVCRDVEWGQTQEVGRIGLLLQDFICRDLIDEITKDLSSNVHVYSASNLPFQVWKRKLCF